MVCVGASTTVARGAPAALPAAAVTAFLPLTAFAATTARVPRCLARNCVWHMHMLMLFATAASQVRMHMFASRNHIMHMSGGATKAYRRQQVRGQYRPVMSLRYTAVSCGVHRKQVHTSIEQIQRTATDILCGSNLIRTL